MEQNRKAVRLFLIITIGLSIVWEALVIFTGVRALIAPLMWTPALAAIIAVRVYFRGEKHALLLRRCRVKYILLSLLLPLVYIGIPYVIYWLIRPGAAQIVWNRELISAILLGVPMGLLTALGEELGWRGFLVPKLVPCIGLNRTLLYTGLFWGLWHCPLLLSGLYLPGTPVWYKLPVFLVVIMAVGVMIGVLTLRSNSVWPAAVMHAAHNAFDQMVFGACTAGEDRMFFVSETGMLTAVIAVALAYLMYRSYAKTLEGRAQASRIAGSFLQK